MGSAISRRDIIKLVGVGLLAGCRPAGPAPPDPTAVPAGVAADDPTAAPPPTSGATTTARPTDTPLPEATTSAAPTPPPTLEPTPMPTSAVDDIATIRAAGVGRVVQVHHAGAWSGDTLDEQAVHDMLDAAIARLTGLEDAMAAWGTLFGADERIAIKVNAISSSRHPTHVALVMGVAERLQEIGVPAEQIVIFDRRTSELEWAGYTVRQDGAGVRCYGTEGGYTPGWRMMDTDVQLSDVLLACDALINIPVLKQHGDAGISFAMKNHYGTFDLPQRFHGGRIGRGMAELNALAPIKDKTRLIVGDVLAIVERGWQRTLTGDSILMSFDPLAHDAVGLDLYSQALVADGRNADYEAQRASTWLAEGAELGLGVRALDRIERVEVNL